MVEKTLLALELKLIRTEKTLFRLGVVQVSRSPEIPT